MEQFTQDDQFPNHAKQLQGQTRNFANKDCGGEESHLSL